MIGPFCGKMGGNYRQQMGPLYRTTRIQDTIQQNSSFVICSDQNVSILLPLSQRRDQKPSQQTGSGKGTESGNSRFLFPDLPSSKKERKVTFDYRPFFIELIHKETVFQNGDSQVGKTSDETQRLGCLHRLNSCIPTRSDTSSIPEVSSFRLRRSGLSLHGLTVQNVAKSVDIFNADGRYSSVSTPTCHISFPYLDDWLIKNLIRNHLITQTRFCIQIIQSLGFLPNLKKSDLVPSQKFTFIGMEFLTQQNLVRVPADRVQNLFLTIKKFLSFKHVSARTFLSLLGTLSAASDFVILGRLHLRPLQMCLLSVWKPHILPLDHPITINGMIRFHLQWWINPNRFETGTAIHPPDPKFFLYTDASHFGWGAQLEPTAQILSWSLDRRPIPAPYQYVRNDGHTIGSKISHNIYSPFLHHDIYRQHNSGLIYQQTGWHSFSQPLPRSLGNSQLVSGTRHRYQSLSHSRQIQHSCRLPIKIRQTYQDRMGSGSNSSEFSIPDAQFSKCGFVCDSIQSQTPIICLPSTRQQSTSDRCPVHGLESSSCIMLFLPLF